MMGGATMILWEEGAFIMWPLTPNLSHKGRGSFNLFNNFLNRPQFTNVIPRIFDAMQAQCVPIGGGVWRDDGPSQFFLQLAEHTDKSESAANMQNRIDFLKSFGVEGL